TRRADLPRARRAPGARRPRSRRCHPEVLTSRPVRSLFEQFGFLAPDWKDLLEILVVTFLFYRILLVLAGTRAIQMLLGLVLLVVTYFLARVLNLDLLRYLLENLFEF